MCLTNLPREIRLFGRKNLAANDIQGRPIRRILIIREGVAVNKTFAIGEAMRLMDDPQQASR
jgi:hypothetical protein